MVYIGIDATYKKHDCFTLSSESQLLADVFTIRNIKDKYKSL